MNIEINDAEDLDEDVLVGLIEEFYVFEELSFDEEKVRGSFQRLVKNDSLGKIWRIVFEKETVGYIVLTYGFSFESGGRDALIDEIFIRGDFRRRGIGRKVFEFVEEFCKTSGVGKIYLEVERKNRSAQEFYWSIGFIDHDRYLLSKEIIS